MPASFKMLRKLPPFLGSPALGAGADIGAWVVLGADDERKRVIFPAGTPACAFSIDPNDTGFWIRAWRTCNPSLSSLPSSLWSRQCSIVDSALAT